MKFSIIGLASSLVAAKYDNCWSFVKTEQYYGDFCADYANADVDTCNEWGTASLKKCNAEKVCKEDFDACDGEDCDTNLENCKELAALATDGLTEIKKRPFMKWLWTNKRSEMKTLMKAYWRSLSPEEKAAKEAKRLAWWCSLSEEQKAEKMQKWKKWGKGKKGGKWAKKWNKCN